jgi:transcriptional regulator with XRE-family HTH domain
MKTVAIPLTNVEVGKRIGVDPSTASYFRHGRRLPSMTTLMAIFKAFDVSPEEQEKITKAINKKGDRQSRLNAFGKWMRETIYTRPSIDV